MRSEPARLGANSLDFTAIPTRARRDRVFFNQLCFAFQMLIKHSLVPNRPTPPLINFSEFFHPGHSYSNHPTLGEIPSNTRFQDTYSFCVDENQIINQIINQKILIKNQNRLLALR